MLTIIDCMIAAAADPCAGLSVTSVCVCVCVRALNEKGFELSTANFVDIQSLSMR